MIITSSGIINGKIDDRYGKFGDNGLSLPFSIAEEPEGTKCFALLLEDKDAMPVCGFSWIHWVAFGFNGPDVPEDASRKCEMVQGVNSLVSPLGGNASKEEASRYSGMAPPDAPHYYELHVFALDCVPQLESGFYANQLFHAMRGHILAQDTLGGWYRNA